MKETIRTRFSLHWLLCGMIIMGTVQSVSGETKSSLEYIVYVGTYTHKESKGIYRLLFDAQTGSLKKISGATPIKNPSFLEVHPSGKYLYAVSEVGDYQKKKSGAVVAYQIHNADGDLKQLNELPTEGGAPCHLSIDPTGHSLVVANYTGGSIASYELKQNGELVSPMTSFMQHVGSSANKSRQEAAHAHSATISADNKFVYAADLGIDQVVIYQFEPQTGLLKKNEPSHVSVKPGSGPRHFAIHPTLDFAYVLNELSCDLVVFSRNVDNGGLQTLQTIPTVPEVKQGYSTAEVRIHPNGKYLYASNRGHHSLSIYEIDQTTGKLSQIGNESTGGKTPRNFNIDPTGKYILAANQDSDNIVVFEIDSETGLLKQTENEVSVSMPICIRFLKRQHQK